VSKKSDAPRPWHHACHGLAAAEAVFLVYLLVDRTGGGRHSPGMPQKLRLQYPGAIDPRMKREDRRELINPFTRGFYESGLA
jgi:hypothetical protein